MGGDYIIPSHFCQLFKIIGKIPSMTRQRTSRKQEGMCLYLEFHLPQLDDFTSNIKKINNILDAEFKGTYSMVYSSNISKELIYKIQKPVLDSNEELESFFYSLQLIFNIAAEFSPHFTQFEGDKHNGN